jgi:hypothetical protein
MEFALIERGVLTCIFPARNLQDAARIAESMMPRTPCKLVDYTAEIAADYGSSGDSSGGCCGDVAARDSF